MKGETAVETTVQGLSVHYEVTGSGPDILLLHGWGSSMEVYARIIAAFSDRFRFTAVDFPGCGGSEILKEPWGVAEYADFILAFIKQAGLENPMVFGHSHGGRMALYMAGKGLLAPPKIVVFGAAGLKQKKTAGQKLRLYSFKTAKWFLTLPGLRKWTAGTLDRVRAYFGSADYNAAPPVMRQTLVRLVNEDIRSVLPAVKAPTLLIWGEKDTATPLSDGKIMEHLIPDAGLCVVSGAGHYSFLERPGQVESILEAFL